MGKLDTLELRGIGTEEDFFLPLQTELSDFDLGGDSQGVWRHGLYRAWLNWETERFQLILGRQRIPWGVGRLWNPIDRFNPIPPLAIEQSQSQGVDSVVATWFATDFASLDAVYAPRPGAEPADYALRLHGLVADTDYSLMGGVFDDATTFGATLERNLWQMALHLEAVWADPDAVEWQVGSARPRDIPSFWQVVVSHRHQHRPGEGYLRAGRAPLQRQRAGPGPRARRLPALALRIHGDPSGGAPTGARGGVSGALRAGRSAATASAGAASSPSPPIRPG